MKMKKFKFDENIQAPKYSKVDSNRCRTAKDPNLTRWNTLKIKLKRNRQIILNTTLIIGIIIILHFAI